MSNKDAAKKSRSKKTDKNLVSLSTYIPKEDKKILTEIKDKHGLNSIGLAVSMMCRNYTKK